VKTERRAPPRPGDFAAFGSTGRSRTCCWRFDDETFERRQLVDRGCRHTVVGAHESKTVERQGSRADQPIDPERGFTGLGGQISQPSAWRERLYRYDRLKCRDGTVEQALHPARPISRM